MKAYNRSTTAPCRSASLADPRRRHGAGVRGARIGRAGPADPRRHPGRGFCSPVGRTGADRAVSRHQLPPTRLRRQRAAARRGQHCAAGSRCPGRARPPRIARAHVVATPTAARSRCNWRSILPPRSTRLHSWSRHCSRCPVASGSSPRCLGRQSSATGRGSSGSRCHGLCGVAGAAGFAAVQRALPGALALAEVDADTFFQTELPALQAWRFASEEARRIEQPLLVVRGADSDAVAPVFGEGIAMLRQWLPRAETFVVPEATHGMPFMNPCVLAEGLMAFFARHPLPSRIRRSEDAVAHRARTRDQRATLSAINGAGANWDTPSVSTALSVTQEARPWRITTRLARSSSWLSMDHQPILRPSSATTRRRTCRWLTSFRVCSGWRRPCSSARRGWRSALLPDRRALVRRYRAAPSRGRVRTGSSTGGRRGELRHRGRYRPRRSDR